MTTDVTDEEFEKYVQGINRLPENEVTEPFMKNKVTDDWYDMWYDGPLSGVVNYKTQYYLYMYDVDEKYSLFQLSHDLLEKYKLTVANPKMHDYFDWLREVDYLKKVNDLWCEDVMEYMPEGTFEND